MGSRNFGFSISQTFRYYVCVLDSRKQGRSQTGLSQSLSQNAHVAQESDIGECTSGIFHLKRHLRVKVEPRLGKIVNIVDSLIRDPKF